jgi:curved DNA-binding protein CbpA
MAKDYYAILGVSRAADSSTIHSAFRALARQYHPDAGTGSSPSKFRDALEAYQTLSDPARRRQHDIDLGGPPLSQRVVAEPLFDPARSPFHSMAFVSTDFDELMKNLLRSIELDSYIESLSYYQSLCAIDITASSLTRIAGCRAVNIARINGDCVGGALPAPTRFADTEQVIWKEPDIVHQS